MATPKGGKETPVPRGLLDRLSGAWNGWFGPSAPLTPIAPPAEVEGRRFDYPFGVNLAYQPRAEQGQAAVPFWLLRQIADPAQGGLDLLRLAISKRKRQMAKLRWKLQAREDGGDGGTQARKLEQLLRLPDGQRTFRQWQGMLLEDHFVIDAVAVYPRAHPEGVRLEPMDGSTIKLVIDEFGRTPMPPLPAYQQFLKGVPAVDYTTDELRYYATDQRTDHIYGYSRVEQVIGIVSIALNRQLSVGSYYTKGSIPEMLLQMPDSLSSSKQLLEFDVFWKSLLSGNIEDRWQTKMIPAGATPIFAKDALLKDAFDEWLARIVCFAFDLPPTSLVKETNRSVSETQKEAAEEEGLEDIKLSFKDWIDDMLARDFGAENIEFMYDEEEVVDQKENAEIVQILYGGTTGTAKPIITLAEARERASYDPPTPAQLEELQPPVPDPLAPDGSQGNGDAPPSKPNGLKPDAQKAANGNGHRRIAAPALEPHHRVAGEQRIRRAVAHAFDAMRKDAVNAARKAALPKEPTA